LLPRYPGIATVAIPAVLDQTFVVLVDGFVVCAPASTGVRTMAGRIIVYFIEEASK
jgi:hypothetical protein